MSTTNMNFISILISTLTRRSLDPLVYLSVYLRDKEKYIQQQKAMSRQFLMADIKYESYNITQPHKLAKLT